MNISQDGLNRIKGYEGERLEAYLDSVGIPTIGVGHTGKDVRMGMKISKQESDVLLRLDLVTAENAVNRAVTAKLTQNQFDALVSLAFNIGGTAFANSTLVKLLNAKDYAGAAAQFLRWNKAGGKTLPGLSSRRAAEMKHFMGA